MINTSSIYTDLRELFPLMLRSGNIYQYEGYDHFDIHYGRMTDAVPTEKPLIFFHSIDPSGELVFNSVGSRRKTMRMRVGVRCNETSPVEASRWQINRLVDMFTPEFLFALPMTFTYNGETLVNESIAKLGFTGATMNGMQEYPDKDCNCVITEMACSYTIDFKRETFN